MKRCRLRRSARRFLTLAMLGFVLSFTWTQLTLSSWAFQPPGLQSPGFHQVSGAQSDGISAGSLVGSNASVARFGRDWGAGEIVALASVAGTTLEPERRGNQAYQSGDMAAAQAAWQTALEQYRAQRDQLGQARMLSNLSLVHQHLGDWPAAERAIAQSFALLEFDASAQAQDIAPNLTALPPQRQAALAQALNTLGKLDFDRGQAQAALTHWQSAAQLYQQIGNPTAVLHSQLNQLQALKALGAYRRALQLAESLQGTIRTLPDNALKLAGFLQSGELLRIAGDRQQAQQLLEESLTLAQALNLPTEASEAQFNLGALAHAQGDRTKALARYGKALRMSPLPSVPLQLARLRLFIDQQDWQVAQQLWPQIQQQLAAAPVTHDTLFQQTALAHELLRSRKKTATVDISAVEGLLNGVIANAQRLGDVRAESYALGTLGQLYLNQHALKKAEQPLQQALMLAQGIPAPEMLYRWQWKLAQVMREAGRSEAAIAHYNAAVETLGSLQNDLVALNPNVLFSFEEDIEPLYREFVALLMEASDRQLFHRESSHQESQGQTLQQAKLASRQYLNQTETVMQTLRLSEMSNFLGQNCFQLQQAQAQALEDLDDRAAIIYPIVQEHQLDILLHLPNQPLRHYSTAIEQAALNRLLQQLNHYLVVRSRRNFLPLAQQLYDIMLRPLEQDLAASPVETLVFSLDRNLQGIPMAALHDGQQYVVERYAMAVTPSLQLFQTQSLNRDNAEVLAVGLSEARNGFAALPFVRTELDRIQTQFPKSATLLDEGFTREALRQKLLKQYFPIVHIATHGQVSSQPDRTFLLAWDQAMNVKQLDQLLQMPRSRRREAIELLVLSACETAAEDERGTLGLAGMAIQSGARSTIGSLWHVNDQATAVLMQAFYRHLSRGETRSQALRQAQLELIHQPGYDHPVYWAPYILIGSWL